MYFQSQCRNLSVRATVSGFGLVELMVSVAIMMLLTSVILVRQSSFNGAVLLRSQAYEVAFAIRRAQLMAVSGNNRGVAAATTTQQYGVFFDTDTPNTYILFHDVNANGQWDPGAIPPDVQIGAPGTIDKRFKIKKICDVNGNDITGNGPMHTSYAVSFIRPNFDAKFNDAVDGSYETLTPIYIDIAQINTTSTSSDDVRRVEIGGTGEISVTTY